MDNVLFRRGDQTFIDENVPLNDGQIIFNETDEAIYLDVTINNNVVRKRYGGGNLSRSDIDMAFSTTSENPIANKVVTNAIGNLPSLQTNVKTNLVGAINEVNTKVAKTEDLISNSGDAYSPSKPYKYGDLCIYNNVLYRCITACSAGSWATNQSCFTPDTLTRVANDLNSGLTNLNTQIGGVKNVSISNTGDSATLDILFTDWSGFFRIECMNRRENARPFSAIVQKYNFTTNYVVLSNYATDESAFNCSNISGGIRVTLPFTYASVIVSSVTSFTLSVV